MVKRQGSNQAYPLHIFASTIPPPHRGQFGLGGKKKKKSGKAPSSDEGRGRSRPHHLLAHKQQQVLCDANPPPGGDTTAQKIVIKKRTEGAAAPASLLSPNEKQTVICQDLFITWEGHVILSAAGWQPLGWSAQDRQGGHSHTRTLTRSDRDNGRPRHTKQAGHACT